MGGLVRLLPFTSPLLTFVVVCPGRELYRRFMFIEWLFMMLPLVIVLIGLVFDRPCLSSSVVEKLCCGCWLLCLLVMLSMAVLSGPGPWVLILATGLFQAFTPPARYLTDEQAQGKGMIRKVTCGRPRGGTSPAIIRGRTCKRKT